MHAFVDVFRPANRFHRIGYALLCIFIGSLFLAVLSQFSIQLWFTPVPITLQTLGVMLMGALLGSKKGALSILTYLGEGALGLPVFAGGSGGAAVLCGPTGGYLFAFVLSTFFVGYLFEKGWQKSYLLTIAALSFGSAIILSLGALWLGLFVGFEHSLTMGVYPFLIGGVVKILAASVLIPSGWKLFGKDRHL